ncbi:Trichodiene synthase [Aspergillus affinis]|uniref:Trichodiene synthase n=1 Tax=Aspergillus affinis TaxID=1070780 RepID=UPI0022FE8693|nr:Trichodiene synthase [Aspergillus affinis]KAI9035199.1 Trichodiene synthase [Aspergillus affinis]
MSGIQEESVFGFDGLSMAETHHIEAVKELIKGFLENVEFDRSRSPPKSPPLEFVVWVYFRNLNLGEEIERAVHKVILLSVTLTNHSYASLPFENKVLCAIQFVFMFLVDDIAPVFMEELRFFCQNFVLNKGHQHPLLHHFDRHLRYLSRFYGPYCHSTIVKSLFDYVNGRIIENEMEQSNFRFSPTTRLMPMFLRTKVGAAEILTALLWPQAIFPEEIYLMQYFPALKELVLFTDFTNDILSYYKEFIINEEKGNFVANLAEAHEVSHLQILKHLSNYTPQVLHSVYKMFSNNHMLLEPVQDFVNGWIALCTAQPRYHLVELFADENYLPPYDDDS